ncbi:inactive transglutaminase family protein [Gilvimarinus sp. SDUM040013]|uniref:Inactive transglutaminase family protein n=1 Tax=Gilvimarinus gilvus TaxID=3058038 RepID=A0ABU4RVE8_9GAMM|nr:inactive transglutaminase family protein [Gilvimarinus sp. SDUM040013]MDO3387711.1 inactive transglutaminase family protein [Gilvimarinus sp. SDUM040013]MDX6848848.1 inactive transglutaminase family protein [Gilvimarinus sp. SDUM040013]
MNRGKIPFYLLVLSLIGAGLTTAWLRHSTTEIPLVPGEQKPVWLIEARVDFFADGGATTITLDLPDEAPAFRLIREQAASPGYGFAVLDDQKNRRAEWTKREAYGLQTLYYNAQYQPVEADTAESANLPKTQSVYWSEPQSTAARELLRGALARSSTPASTARELIKLLNPNAADQNAELLLANESSRAELLVKLLNQAEVPARQVMALKLEDARRRQVLQPMVELYADGRWLLIDSMTGEQGLPDNLLLWSRGENSQLDVIGGQNSRLTFSMIRQTVPAMALSQVQFTDNLFSMLGVYSLPIEEQSMFKMLFLLPLGAMVVVFMRVMIGLKTAGTFMPILISLAFLQTSLVPGLISFVLIVGLGLLLRSYLSYLNLLLVARIATLIVLVIFLISILSLVGYQLGFNTGITITFFPMIIIAWTIERMSILWEEEGAHEVLIQGGGSLLVAVFAFLLMNIQVISHLSFNFPELNLVILALILMMGQYTGYKLSELHRFRSMSNANDVD